MTIDIRFLLENAVIEHISFSGQFGPKIRRFFLSIGKTHRSDTVPTSLLCCALPIGAPNDLALKGDRAQATEKSVK
jgi:hypothetical protein